MTNPLEYVHFKMPEDGKFKISPSAFSDFVEKPHRWYYKEVAKTDDFEYNTSSVLGTIVHYCAEQIAKNEEVDKQAIEDYINSKEPNDEFDPAIVRAQYKTMAERIVNDYVHPNKNSFFKVEESYSCHVRDGFYVAGTPDLLQGSAMDCMITDYKTYNKTTKPRAIPSYYKYQLLTYAYLLGKNDITATRIRLVYVNRFIEGKISEKTGKRGKEYPPEITVLTEEVTPEDMQFIDSMINLCIDTVEMGWIHPELLHIIYHDPRLKPE